MAACSTCITPCAATRRPASSRSRSRIRSFPKKCGHTPVQAGRADRSTWSRRSRSRARRGANPEGMLVIARTDARQTDGFEGAVKRGLAYGEAGADIVFLEALESEAEMREACKRIDKPMMANMADGGKTPIRSKSRACGDRLRAGDLSLDHRPRRGRGDGKRAANPQGGRAPASRPTCRYSTSGSSTR